MHWKKVRSYFTEWGHRIKGKKGGQPVLKRPGYKKRLRERELPRVERLHKKGLNPTEISKKVRNARETICYWINYYL